MFSEVKNLNRAIPSAETVQFATRNCAFFNVFKNDAWKLRLVPYISYCIDEWSSRDVEEISDTLSEAEYHTNITTINNIKNINISLNYSDLPNDDSV